MFGNQEKDGLEKYKDGEIMKLYKGWKRIKEEEEGQVYRWYEKEGDMVASLIEGYFPDEVTLRIRIGFTRLPEVRGHKSIVLKETDKQIIDTIERTIDTSKLFNIKPKQI